MRDEQRRSLSTDMLTSPEDKRFEVGSTDSLTCERCTTNGFECVRSSTRITSKNRPRNSCEKCHFDKRRCIWTTTNVPEPLRTSSTSSLLSQSPTRMGHSSTIGQENMTKERSGSIDVTEVPTGSSSTIRFGPKSQRQNKYLISHPLRKEQLSVMENLYEFGQLARRLSELGKADRATDDKPSKLSLSASACAQDLSYLVDNLMDADVFPGGT